MTPTRLSGYAVFDEDGKRITQERPTIFDAARDADALGLTEKSRYGNLLRDGFKIRKMTPEDRSGEA